MMNMGLEGLIMLTVGLVVGWIYDFASYICEKAEEGKWAEKLQFEFAFVYGYAVGRAKRRLIAMIYGTAVYPSSFSRLRQATTATLRSFLF